MASVWTHDGDPIALMQTNRLIEKFTKDYKENPKMLQERVKKYLKVIYLFKFLFPIPLHRYALLKETFSAEFLYIFNFGRNIYQFSYHLRTQHTEHKNNDGPVKRHFASCGLTLTCDYISKLSSSIKSEKN